jgi:hypothetical protein
MASVRPGPFQDFYQAALAKGIKPTMASGVTSKAANGGHFKTGQRKVAWD